MREYVVSLNYEHEVHPVRDVFIDHPDLLATSLAISATSTTGWRVERITGSEPALDALESVYLDPEVCNECIYPHDACDAQHVYEVIEREPGTRTIYRSTTEETFCYSVSVIAMETLGPGIVIDAIQRGPIYEWRLLIPEDRDLGAFHENLNGDLPSGVNLSVLHVGQPERWQWALHGDPTEITVEQRNALEAAIRLGYYEYPRRATLEDIADDLDLPVTTLRYRLRRAESWAVSMAQRLSDPERGLESDAVETRQD